MASYVEIIYLSVAMIIFSMLSMNTARNFNSSRTSIYRTEVEYRAIAVAQDELDKVQWIYDDSELDPDDGSYVYQNYPLTETHTYGSSDQYSDDFVVYASSELIEDTGSQKRYQVTVSVLNENVSPEVFITLDYVKSYSY
ncbi:MAG: hypothetical protein JJ971_13035 [Balneolaceae bacterium]|nr:hypothetical protein [Balneolaceae bacterium]MBO6547222.1 hypothetical protein [Balneolaceae bacterium]MBO6647831.1 hypothetical protein [Balneolaceae bacterium]